MTLLPGIRPRLRAHLVAEGYSAEQSERAVGKIGDGKLLAMLVKYGPDLLRIALILIAVLGEPPRGTR